MKYFQKYGLYLLFVLFALLPNTAETASYTLSVKSETSTSQNHTSLSKEKNILFSHSFLISDNITVSLSQLPSSSHSNAQNKDSAERHTNRQLDTSARYYIAVQHSIIISLPPYDIIYPFHSFW